MPLESELGPCMRSRPVEAASCRNAVDLHTHPTEQPTLPLLPQTSAAVQGTILRRSCTASLLDPYSTQPHSLFSFLPADERSPLCGHTYDSLAAMHAEVVVTFEATTEASRAIAARPLWSCLPAHVSALLSLPPLPSVLHHSSCCPVWCCGCQERLHIRPCHSPFPKFRWATHFMRGRATWLRR